MALYFHARGERGALFAWLYILAAAASGLVLLSVAMLPPLRALFFRGIPDGLVLLGLCAAPLPAPRRLRSASALVAARPRARLRRDALGPQPAARPSSSRRHFRPPTASPGCSGDGSRLPPWSPSFVVAAVAGRAGLERRSPTSRRPRSATADRRRCPREPSRFTAAPTFCCSPAFGRTAEIGAYSLAQADRRDLLARDRLARERPLRGRHARRTSARARSEARRAFRALPLARPRGTRRGISGGELLIRMFFASLSGAPARSCPGCSARPSPGASPARSIRT